MIWSRKTQKTSMNFISAHCFTHAFHSQDICQEFVKSELLELFQIPCSCGRSFVVIKRCENFLSLNLYVIRMSLSTVSVILHLDSRTLQLQNFFFGLLFKWLLSLELIPSSQRQNDNGDIFKIQCSFWSLVDIDNLIIYNLWYALR